jgi:hypothetical protein
MKSVVYQLFCAYILLLSVLPCADGFGQSRSDSQQVIISADNHQHPQHHTGSDFCSPFCACSCCGTVLDTTPQFQFTYLQIQVSSIDCFGALNLTIDSPTLPSWQPPLIG